MSTPFPATRLLALTVLSALLCACGGGDSSLSPASEQPQPAAAVPAEPSASPAPATPAPRATPTAELKEDLLSVSFLRISDAGFPEMELTNLTDRDIETISGSFLAKNAEGAQVWGTGLTVAVPGQVFLAAGAKRVATPFGLNRKPEMMEILRTDPDSLSFSFLVREIGYRGD